MSLFATTGYHVTPRQQAPETDPYFPETPAPPPSPRCHPQQSLEEINMHHLDQEVEAQILLTRCGFEPQLESLVDKPEASPRRRTISMSESAYKGLQLCRVVSADEPYKSHEEDNDDFEDATMFSTSNPPSSRYSGATLLGVNILNETSSTKKHFTLPSRTHEQQRPSTSYGETSQPSLPISSKEISFPVTQTSTTGPNMTITPPNTTSSKTKSYPGRGFYCPSRPSPQIPCEEMTSHWSESGDDENGEKKKTSMTHVRITSFPSSKGKRFRRRLSDILCGS